MSFPNMPASSYGRQTEPFCPPQSFENDQSQNQPQSSFLLPQRRQPSNQDWEMLKGDIHQWYLEENKTLKELGKRLCAKHGFRPTEKQLTKRLERWNFRKNKSRKKTLILTGRIVEARHGRRFEPMDTLETHRNQRNFAKSNIKLDVEHMGAGFESDQILEICPTKNPDTQTVLGTICKTPSIPENASGSIVTALAHQLSGLNIYFPDDISLFEKPCEDDTPKEYLTNEDIKELAIFGCSSTQEILNTSAGTISLPYPQRYGKWEGPFKLQGYDVDFPSSILVPSLSGELYPFPRSQPSGTTSRPDSTTVIEKVRRNVSDCLARFKRMSQAAFPETHPAMIAIMNELGRKYYELSQGCDSEVWHRRELSARLLSGESRVSIGILEAELNIADTLEIQRLYQEAKVLQKKVHQNIVDSEVASPHDNLFCNVLTSLGWTLYLQGYLDDAEVYLRESFQIRLNSLGPWNEKTLWAMRYLGEVFSRQNRHESEAFVTTTVQICTEIFGISGMLTLDSLIDLASTKKKLGQLQESETIHRSLIERAERALGDEHPDFLTFMHCFSHSLLEQARLDEAEEIARKTIDLRTKCFGQDDQKTMNTVSLLGSVLQAKENYDEAAHCYEKAMRVHSLILGSDNIMTIEECNDLADCYSKLGRFEDAFQLLERFIKEVEIQVASRNEPCWGDGGLPKIQGWIGLFKEDIKYYQERFREQDITEVDEECFLSSTNASFSDEGGKNSTEEI